MDMNIEVVLCICGVVLSIMLNNGAKAMMGGSHIGGLFPGDFDEYGEDYDYDRDKRAEETKPKVEVYRCNEDIQRPCVCSGCSGMETGDECCMDAHNMSTIVQGIEIRLLRFKIKEFDDNFETKFRKMILENVINYCSNNESTLEDCDFNVNDNVSDLVLLKDVVFNRIYESENYTAEINKYRVFYDLNVALLVYREETNLTDDAQTDAFVSQDALRRIIMYNITIIERELGVRIGMIRLWDPRPRPFTQAELAGISIGGIVAFLFFTACACSVKGIVSDRRRIRKRRVELYKARLEAALWNMQDGISNVVDMGNGHVSDGLQREASEDEGDSSEQHVIQATVHQPFSETQPNGNLRQNSVPSMEKEDAKRNGHAPNGFAHSGDTPRPRPLGPRLSYQNAISNYIQNVSNHKVPRRTLSHDRIIHPAEDIIDDGEETYHHYDDVTDFSSGNDNPGFESE